ncbi:MAG TPA: hypothetical protein VH619_17270 [Verrucomicrobiae bacterium]|nr:hypothetical protein [Verrucomicrobiae bacterium]
MRVKYWLSLLGVLLLAGPLHADESPVTVVVDPQASGDPIAADFSGLSFEVSLLHPNENGVRYFRPDNLPLINLFRTLGIHNLRIGGNTSDRDARQLPSNADLDSLFAFAKAAGVKVIYCLRLHNGDPQADATIAKYIMSRYAAQMDCFSIGQEPSAYPVGKTDTRLATERMGAAHEKYQYSSYREEWKKFADVIAAAVPDVKFCGPSVHNNGDWARKFMADFAQSNHVALITEHLYPGGAGGKVPSPEIGRDRMLSGDFVRAYQKLHNSFATAAISNGIPYRLEEVNNYFNGGAKNVSDTFASALWGLDFMYWWASHGAAGVNFHTGDRVAAGSELRPSKYTAFFSTTNGYVIRPLGYGIKAFDLGSHGRVIPFQIFNPKNLNLSIYPVLAENRTLYITVINKEHGESAHDADMTIKFPGLTSEAGQAIFLTAPAHDAAATSGETLGGAQIQSDGSWNGNWSPLNHPEIKIPPSSAAIIKLPLQ